MHSKLWVWDCSQSDYKLVQCLELTVTQYTCIFQTLCSSSIVTLQDYTLTYLNCWSIATMYLIVFSLTMALIDCWYKFIPQATLQSREIATNRMSPILQLHGRVHFIITINNGQWGNFWTKVLNLTPTTARKAVMIFKSMFSHEYPFWNVVMAMDYNVLLYILLNIEQYMCVCARVCVRACARVCVTVYVYP
jgi:hypothetical protein